MKQLLYNGYPTRDGVRNFFRRHDFNFTALNWFHIVEVVNQLLKAVMSLNDDLFLNIFFRFFGSNLNYCIMIHEDKENYSFTVLNELIFFSTRL